MIYDLCNYVWDLYHVLRAEESTGKRLMGLAPLAGRESPGNERPEDRDGREETEGILVQVVP